MKCLSGSWRSGFKVVMKSDRGRVSCTRWAREVNYDKIVRRPFGCGPLAVFQNSADANGWIDYVLKRNPDFVRDFTEEHLLRQKAEVRMYADELVTEIIEVIPCVYRQSADDALWTLPGYSGDRWSPDVSGGDYADVVVPLNMGELTDIEDVSCSSI